jgi:hypothetical protein
MPPPPQRPSAPPSLLTAVKLMYAGAALSVVTFLIALTQKDAIRKAIVVRYPSYTDAQIHTATNFGLVSAAVGSIIGLALWLWMASANKKGHTWARVVSSILFGLNTLGLIYILVAAAGTTTIQKIVGVVVWLVALAAVVFLWRPDSSAYFNATT